ncbi:cupin domain-containing protein [Halobacterium jilantaiense]|uniref:Cupin domain-containing protein n=1 Tax=Halobacterium jilantaiense TaxID=355548 RepID=A0A1I0QCX5_9EURY|nr:cupin domain-containing protein [Halobacterium jilantaiense]SEW24910.1 Cupin domain-containing protein [Halobacterium jilantaiense]
MDARSLADAFDAVDDTWEPRLLAELNDQHVKVARLDGEFVWHAHPDADELFYVVDGDLTIEYRADSEERSVRLGPGDLTVAPAGVEHRPVAHEETEVVLFEPAGTTNTGDAEDSDRTVEDVERV